MKATASLLAAATAGLVTSTASALPIFAGSTYDPNTLSGDREAAAYAKGDSTVINSGRAIGSGVHVEFSIVKGERSLAFTDASSIYLQPLVTLPSGYASARPLAMNKNGVAVGTSQKLASSSTTLGNRAVRWSASGNVTELNVLGTNDAGRSDSAAVSVNSFGTATGWADKYNAAHVYLGTRAVRWSSTSSSVSELSPFTPPSTGYAISQGTAINNATTVVGYSDRFNGNTYIGTQAARWNAGTTSPTVLNSLGISSAGQSHSRANDINEAGVTVGSSEKFDQGDSKGSRAVRWAANSSAVTELGVLGGTTVNGEAQANAVDINEAGVTVGYSSKHLLGTYIGTRATYWAAGSTAASELPHLGTTNSGITDAEATAINSSNAISGWALKNGVANDSRAVVWTTAGADQAINLNTKLPAGSGWKLRLATGISDTGFVAGVGAFDVDGPGGHAAYDRLFTMLVPEAGTYGKGDANLDGSINFDDLLIIAQHYDQPNPTGDIHVGDFNLNGQVNFDDLLKLAQHYGSSALVHESAFGAQFAADWTLARSMTPEPASLVALAGLLCVGRRRR